MNVIIVGGGELGTRLAENLIKRAHNQVTIVELSEPRAAQISEELDALVLLGDGTHPDILRKARIEEAHALVAATGSDAINTVVAMLGKRFEVPQMVVRLEETGLRAACQEIGVGLIVAPRIAAAAEMTSFLYGTHRLDFSLVARGGLNLLQLAAHHVDGVALQDLGLPQGSLIVAVIRDPDEVLVPRGPTRLMAGDELMILTESDKITREVEHVLKLDE